MKQKIASSDSTRDTSAVEYTIRFSSEQALIVKALVRAAGGVSATDFIKAMTLDEATMYHSFTEYAECVPPAVIALRGNGMPETPDWLRPFMKLAEDDTTPAPNDFADAVPIPRAIIERIAANYYVSALQSLTPRQGLAGYDHVLTSEEAFTCSSVVDACEDYRDLMIALGRGAPFRDPRRVLAQYSDTELAQ